MRVHELPVARALSAPFANEHAFGGELLDAAVACVCNVDATVGCHRDANRLAELPVARAIRAPIANEHAFRGELLDAVVACV